MIRRALLLLALSLCPALALAAPAVEGIVDKSVEALETTSYEARMLYLSQFGDRSEQRVRIVHLAPYMYRVEPIDSQNQTEGVIYYEDEQRLVRYVPRKGTEELPDRRYYINDRMTVKFLIDLAKHPGTTVLDGRVGDREVYILRQDAISAKPYSVTVGVDKKNYFPLLLLVNDSKGKRRVYFEMEAIEFVSSSKMDKAQFRLKDEGMENRPAPQISKVDADVQIARGGSGAQVVIQREGSSSPYKCAVPLYPTWVPEGYRVESIGILDYFPGLGERSGPQKSATALDSAAGKIVFRIEARGGSYKNMISVIQTRADQQPYDFGGARNIVGEGFLLQQVGDWLVAVISGPDVSVDELERIAGSLEARDGKVEDLIRQTRLVESLLQQAGAPIGD